MQSTQNKSKQSRLERLAIRKALLQMYWAIFTSKNPTDEACYEAILNRAPELLRCKNCHGSNFSRQEGEKVAMCLDCKTETWFFAGTFFDHIKRPKAWLGSIWLLEQGIPFNALELSQLAEISYEPAYKILKKLSIVITEYMRENPETILTASLNFMDVVQRRSLRTPAQEHPRQEQRAMEEEMKDTESPTQETQSATNRDDQQKPDMHQHVLASLNETPQHFNDIAIKTNLSTSQLAASLTNLQIDGKVEQTDCDFYFLPKGKNHDQSTSSQEDFVNEDTRQITDEGKQSFFDYIYIVFFAIARKYLQYYLALFWCCFDERFWGEDKLLAASLKFRKIGKDEIRGYATPLKVSFIAVE